MQTPNPYVTVPTSEMRDGPYYQPRYRGTMGGFDMNTMLKYFVQFVNVIGLIFFIVAAIMISIKDEYSFNVLTIRLMSGMHEGIAIMGDYSDIDAVDNVGACNSLHGEERDYCRLSKVPVISSAWNSPGSIWPGKSIDVSFLMFITCINYLMFASTFIGYPKNWDPMGYIPAVKGIWLLFVALCSLIALGFYAWDRDTGNSSVFIGLLFYFVTLSYCTLYIFWERNVVNKKTQITERSVLWGAMDNDKSMSLYYTRVLCTTPILLYIVLIQLNPSYGDFLFNVAVWVSVVMFITMLLLEEKMFRIKSEVLAAQQDYGTTGVLSVNTYNYRSEKVAYIIVVMFTFATFLVSLTVAGDFFAISQEEFAASADTRLAYYMLFFIKLIEIGFSLVMYIIDEVQTYFTYYDKDGNQRVRAGGEPVMVQFSAFRFAVHSTLDYVIVLTIVINYLSMLYG